jgi:hypothetical protein
MKHQDNDKASAVGDQMEAGSHSGAAGGSASHDKNEYGPYIRLGLMIVISFAAMFALMYAMVDVLANAVPNLNQLYMAGLMTAPMLLIEIWLMRAMYPNTQLNLFITAFGAVALLFFWTGIRQQVAIDDQQFLKSMIPHHAGAILMCEQADIKELKVKQLCGGIISAQKGEIAQMRALIVEIQTKR